MAPVMRFFSDNAAAACPEVLAALAEANRIDTAYDGDRWSKRLNAAFSALFEREVEALWVATGTAANSLALAALCPPHGAIVCHRDAHIQNDECGAPEFYTGGAKLLLGEGRGREADAGGGRRRCSPRSGDDVHQVQPAALSITNATEYGLRLHARRDGGARRALQGARARLPRRRRPLRQCGGAASAARPPI